MSAGSSAISPSVTTLRQGTIKTHPRCFPRASLKGFITAELFRKPTRGGCVMAMLSQKSCTVFVPLREHSLMRRGPIFNWPPVWNQPTKEGNKTLHGEVGVLRYVHSSFHSSNKCFLVIEYNGQHYVGALLFVDNFFCSQICALLHHHLGQPIKEIGDLDVSFTAD
jgi:hypothetical protein